MSKKYEFLEHTADIKFRVRGKTLNEVFENSVLAVSEFLSRDEKIKGVKEKRFKVEGNDLESLYYNFLDEIVFLLDAKDFVVSHAKVNVDKKTFKAEGNFFGNDTKLYPDLDHFKAATYAEMYIKKLKNNTWESQAVLDV